MRIRRLIMWTALALAGLLVAVGITMAATELTSQHVGLQAEPIHAGEDLAPTSTPTATATPRPKRTPTPTATVDEDESGSDDSDDDSGRGRGRGRGGDEDDD